MNHSMNMKFLKEISKTKEPATFLGICKVLGVQLVGEEKDENNNPLARPFEDLFKDVMEAYAKATRIRRRELYQILCAANKEDKRRNATRAKNSKESVSGEAVPEMSELSVD